MTYNCQIYRQYGMEFWQMVIGPGTLKLLHFNGCPLPAIVKISQCWDRKCNNSL